MCTICFATQTFDPTRHSDFDLTEFVGDGGAIPGTLLEAGPTAATFTETTDAAAGTNTTYTMDVGDVFVGDISNGTDSDWVAITLEAGTTYNFNLDGTTLQDPLINIKDASGTQVVSLDDGINDFSAGGNYTASTTGTYYVEVKDYTGTTNTGGYSFTVTEVGVAGTVGTYQEMADYLTSGFWGGNEIKWDTSASNVITVDITDLTAAGQQLALWAMEAWESVANLNFTLVSSGSMIKVDDESSGAYAYAPGGSDTDGTVLNVSKGWLTSYGTTLDSYSFQTYVHEFGHALGLGHMGPYDGQATYGDPTDTYFTNDSWQLSVMSYFNQTDNTTTDASYGYLAGPSLVDILAIQDLYGAPGAASATFGDTIFGANSNLGSYLDDIFDWFSTGVTTTDVTGNSMAFTIYDVDGNDTIDLSFLTVAAQLNLNEGEFSDLGTLNDILGIALGTEIENAILGSGDDTVLGNAAANSISGGGGKDTISGEDGNDTIDGGAGGDELYGGDDIDQLYGDFGNDTLFGGVGNDGLYGQGNSDSAYGGEGNDLLVGDQGFDKLYGGVGKDTLYGGSEADRLYGGEGDDYLRGGSTTGSTVDGMYGGDGNDSVFGDGGFDMLDGGDGDDYLDGGHQADNLYGGDGEDTMYGDLGLDRLFGGAGNDIGFGGDGNDGLFGGTGEDTLHGGDGNDRFFGSSGNDVIFGGSGNDTIYGGSSFDTIYGGEGDDQLFGNFNADHFVFSDGHGNDVVGDFAATNIYEKINLSDISAISTIADLQLADASNGAATQVGSDVLIDTGGGSSITLTGVDIFDLDSSDFVF